MFLDRFINIVFFCFWMDRFHGIKEEAKKFFSGSNASHDWEHTCRVYNLCIQMGQKEGIDLEVLGLSAILHDIARGQQDRSGGKICHAEKGAVLAKALLHKYRIDKDKIDKVIHCIETHWFRGPKAPQSEEAKILFDADKLDSIGAVGIGRAFIFAGGIGAKLHNKDADIENTQPYTEEDTAYREFMLKLRKVKGRMLTEEGKKRAQQRHSFMVNFFERLNREVDGRE